MSLVFLGAQTASNSATLNFEGLISSTYDNYEIHLISIVPATDGAKIGLQCGTGGTPTYDTGSNYDWASFAQIVGGTGGNGASSDSAIYFTNGQSSGGNSAFSGVASFQDPNSASLKKYTHGTGVGSDTSGGRMLGWWHAGIYKSTTAVTAFRIKASSGNITSGVVRLYGVSES